MSRRPLTPPPPLSEPELLLPAPEALPNPLLALVHGRLGHRGQCENFKAATPAEVACVSSALRLGVAIVLHPHGLMYAAKAFSPGAAQETLDTVQTAIRRLFSMTEFVVVITKDMYGRADGTYVDPALRVGYGSQIARAVYCHPWVGSGKDAPLTKVRRSPGHSRSRPQSSRLQLPPPPPRDSTRTPARQPTPVRPLPQPPRHRAHHHPVRH